MRGQKPRSHMQGVIRDGHWDVVLEPDLPATYSQLSSGIIFPNPADPSEVFEDSFKLVQIVVTSNFDFYWKLQINLNASGSPLRAGYKVIYGSALTKVPVSMPLAIGANIVKESIMKFEFDNGGGGMGAPPAVGGEAARIQLFGYFNPRVIRERDS